MGQKNGGSTSCPLFHTKWHLDLSSRLGTIEMGGKWEGYAPFWGGELGPHLAQCGLGRGLPPHRVASWFIQLFGHNWHGPKIGGGLAPVPFLWRRELGLHLTQCRLGQNLPLYQVSSWSIEPFGYNRYGPKMRWGTVCLCGTGPGSLSNTMCPGPRPTCMSSFILIRPSFWPQYKRSPKNYACIISIS